MKKQENTTYLNKNRGLKYALCIIILLCCILSTIVQAEYIFDESNVVQFWLYGQSTIESSNSWRNIPFNIQNGDIITEYQVYGQYRQRIHLNFGKVIPSKNIYVTLTYVLNPNIYSPANINFGTEYENIAYVKTSTGNTNLFNPSSTTKSRMVENNTVKYTYEYNGESVDAYGIRIYTNLITVSTDYTIRDLQVVINGEEYQVIKGWEDKQQELEEALQDIEVTVDQNAIDDIINNPPTIDSTINVGIFNFTNETIPLYIMSLTLSLAIISFLLYGKK